MSNLPVETLQNIFDLACTDGGRTGCALSLTSRVVRAVSRTARFRSVGFVADRERLSSFLALYERSRAPAEGNKAHVYHLSLALPQSCYDAYSTASQCCSHVDPEPEVLRRLFRVVAPRLISLVIGIQEDRKADNTNSLPTFSITFPALRDLTVRRLRLSDLATLLPPSPVQSPPMFPACATIRLVLPVPTSSNPTPRSSLDLGSEVELEPGQDGNTARTRSSVSLLIKHAPQTSRFELSTLTPSSSTFDFLADLTEALSTPGRWSSLRELVLQPCAPPRCDGWRGDPLPTERYAELWHAMRRVERAARDTPGEGSAVEVMILDGAGQASHAGHEPWEHCARGLPLKGPEGLGTAAVRRKDVSEEQGRLSSGWKHTTIFHPI